MDRHFFAKYLSKKIENWKYIYWKTVILLISIFLLYMVGWIPETVPDLFVNTIVSFTAAVQFGTFRTFENNTAYASVFCMGNMRSCAEMYYEGLICKNKTCLRKVGKYTGILASFFIGAIFSGKLSLQYGVKAIWVVCFVLGCVWLILICEKNISDSQEWKKNEGNKTHYI